MVSRVPLKRYIQCPQDFLKFIHNKTLKVSKIRSKIKHQKSLKLEFQILSRNKTAGMLKIVANSFKKKNK